MLLELVFLSALANTSPVALYGPAEHLSFGMTVEQLAKAAPKGLYPAFAVSLAPEAFEKAQSAAPELFAGRFPGTGGNRFNRVTSVRSEWPVIDGAKWSVEVNDTGLSRVRIHYESAEATVRLLTKQFGAPVVSARWKVWASPKSHVRAVFTGCFQPTANGKANAPNECTVELSPYRPLEEIIGEDLFPAGKTLLGRPRTDYSLGFVCGVACTTVQLKAYRSSSSGVPLELHWDEAGKLTGYRTQLDYTYEPKIREEILAGLKRVLGPPDSQAECLQWVNTVAVCENRSVFTVTVGTITR